ncbi:hypothetical protein A2311_05750 [candidate division WOR-1 bacterium RIFOXYB2_FULL_48_7]|uniref:General secretion pathway GspH domain-containing protein n=1 Tax=candidate division WOR-1 bacterium RIFOXYB2_FULL_48_7 TaxID=1802583 RepID=A0A1F4TU25_UNCSA|nr:MAG: hypothetical protein A2311_05750 [candidate division WOR-1 bacterium RIFOXYB2_FULL_48_7]
MRRGFTLVELLVVVGLFVLFISLAFSSLHSFRALIQSELQAESLRAELHNRQARALSKGEPCGLTVAGKELFFSASGHAIPGKSGTIKFQPRKVILSSVGRVRIE